MKSIRRFKNVLLATGVAGSVFSYSQIHKINEKVAYIKHKLETNGAEPILDLSTKESAFLPWEFNPSSLEKEDWEFRRVQIKGGLFGTRHFVRRDKGDRPGYLVFTGMPTAQHVVKELDIPLISEATVGAQKGVIVCLGWLPMEAAHKALGDSMVKNEIVLLDDLYKDATKIPPGVFRDPYTGFRYEKATYDDSTIPLAEPFDDSLYPDVRKARIALGQAMYPTSDNPDNLPAPDDLPADSEMQYWGRSNLQTYDGYYNMRGYLRKTEDSDWLLGRTNRNIRNINRVDLAKIAGFYRFRNPSAYEYYIDKSTDDDSEYDNLLPQPNHLHKGFEHLEPFEKDAYFDGYNKMLKWSSVLAVFGLLI